MELPEPPVKFNSTNKQLIRSEWAKPLLAYLHDDLQKKLIYVGLPDTEAHDVKEWLDYLDVVYAFQCRDYPKPSSPDQSRKNVIALENTLRTLERQKLLSTYDVYDGYIEEVLLRGYDNSPTTKEFSQQETVTIYNLDFCGQVTSPIVYKDQKGISRKAFKFNAVDKLLYSQKNVDQANKKFVLFLTLHCSYDGKEFTDFLNNPQDRDIEEYFKNFSGMSKGKKAPYLIKAFVYHQLTRFFTHHFFTPEFLPTIYYKGDNDHPLLFFTVIGTQVENSSALPIPPVKMKNLLNTPIISVKKDGIFAVNEALKLSGDSVKNGDLESLKIFKKTKTFTTFWK
ncbi:hypothetical protein [Mucilaginibacter sp.]